MSVRKLEIDLYPEHETVTAGMIENVCTSHDCITHWIYILHDKDVYVSDVLDENGTVLHRKGDLKKPHFHVFMKFNAPQQELAVLQWFGGQAVGTYSRIKTKKYSDCVRYCFHETDTAIMEGKTHYDYSSAVASFDIQEMLAGKTDADESKYSVLDGILGRIEAGTLKRYMLFDPERGITVRTYALYKTKIENALQFQEKKALKDLNREGTKVEIIYVYGKTGLGKTTYAKELARQKNLDFFVSGSSNDPLDGFSGEPCLILDDLRGSSFSFTDLLKLLDPHTRSQVKSRYSNKILTCQLIIVTSIYPIESLYSSEDLQGEPLAQLRRRCLDMIHFTDDNMIEYFRYSERKQKYEYVTKVPNVYKERFAGNEMTLEEKLGRAASLLTATGMSLQELSQYMKSHAENDGSTYGFVPYNGSTPFDDKRSAD